MARQKGCPQPRRDLFPAHQQSDDIDHAEALTSASGLSNAVVAGPSVEEPVTYTRHQGGSSRQLSAASTAVLQALQSSNQSTSSSRKVIGVATAASGTPESRAPSSRTPAPSVDARKMLPSSPSQPCPKASLSPPQTRTSKSIGCHLAFEVVDDLLSYKQEYRIRHVDETKHNTGDKWLQATPLETFALGAGSLCVNDVVTATFDSDAREFGIIREMRKDHDTFLVVQWLYSAGDAKRLGVRATQLDLWPPETYLLSDHGQVITQENIDQGPVGDFTIDQELYLHTNRKALRALNQYSRKIVQRLPRAVKRQRCDRDHGSRMQRQPFLETVNGEEH